VRQYCCGDARYWYRNSVCPSVCLSRCGVLSKPLNISPLIRLRRMALYKFWLIDWLISSPHGSPVIVVLWVSNIFAKFRWGGKYRWGIKISRFSTTKSLYLANDTKYRHSYYGTLIGTRMRSVEWCRFQWHWVTSNLDFKVKELQ